MSARLESEAIGWSGSGADLQPLRSVLYWGRPQARGGQGRGFAVLGLLPLYDIGGLHCGNR
jgi:hypothetical protein